MRVLVLRATVVMTVGLLLAAVVPVTTAATPHDRFRPSAVTAPWANGEVDENPDNAVDAYGLCRTAAALGLPFSYAAPAAGEVNAIVGDPVNNSGASNFGCTTP